MQVCTHLHSITKDWFIDNFGTADKELPFNDDPDDNENSHANDDDDLDLMDDDDDDINAKIDDKPVSPERLKQTRDTPRYVEYDENDKLQADEVEEPADDDKVVEINAEEILPEVKIEVEKPSPKDNIRMKLQKQATLAEERTKSPNRSESGREIISPTAQKSARRNADLNFKNLKLDEETSSSSLLANPARFTTPKANTTKHAPPMDQRRGSVNQVAKRPPVQPVETPKVSVQQPTSKFGNCRKHKGKPLEVVCMTDKVVICSTCALFDGHQGHQFREVNELQKEIGDRAEK